MRGLVEEPFGDFGDEDAHQAREGLGHDLFEFGDDGGVEVGRGGGVAFLDLVGYGARVLHVGAVWEHDGRDGVGESLIVGLDAAGDVVRVGRESGSLWMASGGLGDTYCFSSFALMSGYSVHSVR